MITFTVSESGKVSIPKDKNGRKLYGVKLTPLLTGGLIISQCVINEFAGVIVDGSVIIQGDIVMAWIKGGDATLTDNFVTFHYTLSDGSEDDQTIYFKIKEK